MRTLTTLLIVSLCATAQAKAPSSKHLTKPEKAFEAQLAQTNKALEAYAETDCRAYDKDAAAAERLETELTKLVDTFVDLDTNRTKYRSALASLHERTEIVIRYQNLCIKDDENTTDNSELVI